jgi:CDP-diacylglycerol--serine O-phosphatidyltransferase
MNIKSLLPNALTMGNLIGGIFVCWAAVSASALDKSLDSELVALVWLGAMLCDGLDGMVARWLKVDGPMGVQLDSLADLVTGGLASACVAYNILLQSGARESVTMLLPILLVIAAAYRLARYNVSALEDENKGPNPFFIGLPVPAVGLYWMGIMMWRAEMYGGGFERIEIMTCAVIVGIGIVGLPLMMVMKKKILSLKDWGVDKRIDRIRYGIGAGCLGVFAATWFAWGNVYAAVPLCVLLYSGVSLLTPPK